MQQKTIVSAIRTVREFGLEIYIGFMKIQVQYGGGTDDCSPAVRYLGNLAPGVFALGEHYSHLVVVLPLVKEEVTQALKMNLISSE